MAELLEWNDIIGGTRTERLGAVRHVGPHRGGGALGVIFGGTRTERMGAVGHVGPRWGGPWSYYWRDPLV